MSMVSKLGGFGVAAVLVCGCGRSGIDHPTGSGGAAGAGGATGLGNPSSGPRTDKVDLLLMIDNSISMADKQALLQESVPRLLDRMIHPPGDATPVTDLHVAVITSSLGGHGADTCSPTADDLSDTNPTQYDGAHLLPSVRAGLKSHLDLGFLWWDPAQKAGGETDSGELVTGLTSQIQAAGENGCGFEASLEAWYRFLIDPAPPAAVVRQSNVAVLQGIDGLLLEQRKSFLRPDSAVAIVMLSDENDCSIMDGGYNWMAAQITVEGGAPFNLPRATSACETTPNAPCCRSCASDEAEPPPGCVAIAKDPACQHGNWNAAADHSNLRCWQQKKRFGADFLYPTRKYAEAVTQPTICSSWANDGECAGQRVANPLFAEGRDPSLVFLTGIVGVPWQDLATTETLNDPDALSLVDSRDFGELGRWSWLVPGCLEQVDPTELPRAMPICKVWNLNDPPDDPLMIESPTPRTGVNPATQQPLAGPGSDTMANSINGHEWNTDQTELQYACIFPLGAPRDCDSEDPTCDCSGAAGSEPTSKPLCQQAEGTYSTQQRYAKAFPGTRQLQVLRDIGQQAVVASICPKSSVPAKSSAYGYNAAMDALAARLDSVLE